MVRGRATDCLAFVRPWALLPALTTEKKKMEIATQWKIMHWPRNHTYFQNLAHYILKETRVHKSSQHDPF